MFKLSGMWTGAKTCEETASEPADLWASCAPPVCAAASSQVHAKNYTTHDAFRPLEHWNSRNTDVASGEISKVRGLKGRYFNWICFKERVDNFVIIP